ncbi:MAG: hypothetical protein P1U34_05145 [Coxiellaceae bacterium]|nr:hypothetical protein [Coxiellaceae bacterium]
MSRDDRPVVVMSDLEKARREAQWRKAMWAIRAKDHVDKGRLVSYVWGKSAKLQKASQVNGLSGRPVYVAHAYLQSRGLPVFNAYEAAFDESKLKEPFKDPKIEKAFIAAAQQYEKAFFDTEGRSYSEAKLEYITAGDELFKRAKDMRIDYNFGTVAGLVATDFQRQVDERVQAEAEAAISQAGAEAEAAFSALVDADPELAAALSAMETGARPTLFAGAAAGGRAAGDTDLKGGDRRPDEEGQGGTKRLRQ